MKKIIYSSLLVLAITLLPSACDNDSDMNSPHGSTTPPEQVVLTSIADTKNRYSKLKNTFCRMIRIFFI